MKLNIKEFKSKCITTLEETQDKINTSLFNNFIKPFCIKWRLSYSTCNEQNWFSNHNNKNLLQPYRDDLKPTTTFLKEYCSLCELIDDLEQFTRMLGDNYQYDKMSKYSYAYIVYNPENMKIIKNYQGINQTINFIKNGNSHLKWLNKTHPKNKEIIELLKG